MKNGRITQTNPNNKNKLKMSRLRFWNSEGKKVGELSVPKYNAKKYCQDHPGGVYGRIFREYCEEAGVEV